LSIVPTNSKFVTNGDFVLAGSGFVIFWPGLGVGMKPWEVGSVDRKRYWFLVGT
jgi:hypothetical protein